MALPRATGQRRRFHQDLPAWFWTGTIGKYIQLMSPHCQGCRYDPAQRSGDSACPCTTLCWDSLMRHETGPARNLRMTLQVKNVARLTDAQKQVVQERAVAIRKGEVGIALG